MEVLAFEFVGEFVVLGESVGVEVFGGKVEEVGAFGAVGGFSAEGFEDSAGVVASAHGHAAGAGDFEDGVGTFAEDLQEAFDFGGAAGHF